MYCRSSRDDVTYPGGSACVTRKDTINYEGLKQLWTSTGIPESDGLRKLRDDEAGKTNSDRKR